MSAFLLNSQLDELRKHSEANSPAEVHVKMNQMIHELQETGIASGLALGNKAKDFVMNDALGNKVVLYDELSKGPVVLTFYRGEWCPYCNLQLRAYQQILPEIHALGAQLIAVTPQTPEHSLTQIENQKLTYRVLSDTNGLAAAKYNIMYEVHDYIKALFEGFGLNLAEYNSTSRWILPVPATFMIDESAIIRSVYVNPNFMQRMEPEDILFELKKL
jgi:peroxiredoxin